ncbi:hypothetical protein MASR2M8_12450 [Opitutaceae bacterium]
MNTDHNDDQLGPLIRRGWTVPAQSNPNFRASVWARIEAGRRLPATWSGWLKLNFASVTMYAAATVVLASAGGGYLAASQANRDRDQLIQRYVTSIDPHQRVASSTAP